MEDILPREETLQQALFSPIAKENLSFDKPVAFRLYLNEYRTQLYDDRLNLIGLTPPKEINYLNFGENFSKAPNVLPFNGVIIGLSNKVQN